MSNKGGDQSILISKGREAIVAKTYREIKDIIQENTSMEFKKAIKKIADVTVGTWYNYISEGTKKGRVSKHTATKLAEFSNVPYKVFTGELNFDDSYKEQFSKKVRERLGTSKNQSLLENNNSNDLELLIVLSKKIDLIKDEDYLSKLDLIVSNLKERIDLNKKTIVLHETVLKSENKVKL